MPRLWLHGARLDRGAVPPRLSLLVIPHDSDDLAQGDLGLCRQVLADLALPARPLGFRLGLLRSPYLATRHVRAPGWRDRFGVGWRLEIELDDAPAWTAPRGLVGSDAVDGSFRAELHHQRAGRARCVVIADFADERGQVWSDLGVQEDGWYAAGGGEAERLAREFRRQGASIHWLDTVARQERGA